MPKIITRKEILQRFRKVHGFDYYYFAVNYIGIHTKVKIYCPRCKKYFYQSPCNHIKNQKCPSCLIKIKSFSVEVFKK